MFDVILKRPLFNLLILLTIIVPGHSLGWAIILLTILVRSLLLPSSAHALKQQHKMKKIQPELKELQEKHKGDQAASSAAMMALYKKHDIHPLGSCLPMLIQLPLLIALFYVFRDGLTPEHLDTLYSFVPRPEALNTMFFGLDLGVPNKVLAVLAGLAQFWQSRMLTQSNATHQPESTTQKILMNQLTYVTPVITIIISFGMPAALPLYWLVTTIFSIVQQWWLFRHMEADVTITTPLPAEQVGKIARGGVEVQVRRRGE